LAVLAVWRIREPRVWILGGLGGLGAVMALGSEGWLFPFLMNHVPQLGFMRFPVKFVVLPAIVVPMLAGLAVHWLLQASPEPGRARVACRSLAVVFGTGAALVACLVLFALRYPVTGGDSALILQQGAVRWVVLGLVGALLYGLTRPLPSQRLGLLALGLLGVIWLDVRSHARDLNPTVSRFVYASDLARTRNEFDPQTTHGGFRAMVGLDSLKQMRVRAMDSTTDDYIGRRLSMYGNCNLLDGVPKLNGFYALYPSDNDSLFGAIYAALTVPPESLRDFLGVAWITPELEMLRWERRPNPMPLVTAGQRPAYLDPEKILWELFNPVVDYRRTVLLPKSAQTAGETLGGGRTRAKLVGISAHSMDIEVDSEGAGMVVIAQSYYPAWKARVNGQPAPLLKANHAFQAVRVPAGASRVRLVYEDRWFQAGCGISLGTLALLLAGIFGRRTPTGIRQTGTWLFQNGTDL
jgi:hypothetical protein